MRYDNLRKIGTLTTETDNVTIDLFDILNVKWTDFKYTNGFKNHTVSKTEVTNPWMISFVEFGSADFEDLNFLINGISNPLDLTIGQTLKIAKKADIISFLNNIRQ